MRTYIKNKAWFTHAVFGFCFVFLFFNIEKVYADVYINEVAWMGTTVSSTNEWVELYNDGTTDLDLDGWAIVSDDGSPNIIINNATKSVIEAKKFYLIERTDDTTVPEVPADFITAFGSGLSNIGEKLLLKKPDGTIVETLDYKTGWPAGDNTTKQTMQKVGSAWVTANPTPKAVNAGAGSGDSNNSGGGGTVNTVSISQTASSVESVKKEVVPPKPKISIIASKTALTNVAVNFDSVYTGANGLPIVSGYFVWSMGDGATYSFTQQKKFLHIYQYPGDYTVSLAYFFNSWSEDPVIETNYIIHVEDAGVTISSLGTDGTISVINNSDQDVSLSKWKLLEGTVSYTFPYGMVVLAHKNIVLSSKITGFNGSQKPVLYYPNGLEFNLIGSAQNTQVLKSEPKIATSFKSNKNPKNLNSGFYNNERLNNIEPVNSIYLTANAAGLEPSSQTKNTHWWVFVVLGIIVCGLGYLAMKFYRLKPEVVQEDFHLLDE